MVKKPQNINLDFPLVFCYSSRSDNEEKNQFHAFISF